MRRLKLFNKISTKFIFVATVSSLVLFFILGLILFNETKQRALNAYTTFAKSTVNGITRYIAK
jgi:hypothetical protein